MDEPLTPNEAFGRNVKYARRRMNWKQQVLVRKLRDLGFNFDTKKLSRVETGQQAVRFDEVIGICLAFGLPPAFLLCPFDGPPIQVSPTKAISGWAFHDWIREGRLLSESDLQITLFALSLSEEERLRYLSRIAPVDATPEERESWEQLRGGDLLTPFQELLRSIHGEPHMEPRYLEDDDNGEEE